MERANGKVDRSTWVPQSVRRPTLGFSSGHDLIFMRSNPASGSVLTALTLLGILSFSLSQDKKEKKRKEKRKRKEKKRKKKKKEKWTGLGREK